MKLYQNLNVTGSLVLSGSMSLVGANNHNFTGSVLVSGSVGIGTNPTSYPIDVYSNVSSSSNILAQFFNNDYTSGTRNFIRVRNALSAGSTYSSYFGQGQDGKTYIISNNFSRNDIVIDGNNGTVSMGVTSSALHSNSSGLIVAGTGGNRGIIEVWDGGSTAGKGILQNVGGITYVGSLASGSGTGNLMLLYGGGNGSAAVGLTISGSNGSVGIGTTSPSDIIDVRKNQNAVTNFYFQNTDTTNTNSRAYLNVVSGNNSLQIKAIHADNCYLTPTLSTSALYLGYGNSMLVSSGGNLEYNVTPNANYNIATDGGKLTVANGGTINFQFFSGLIVINNHSNGNCVMWLVGAGLVSLIGQSASGANTGTMTYNGGITGYTWTSNYGSTAIYGVFAVRTRSNA